MTHPLFLVNSPVLYLFQEVEQIELDMKEVGEFLQRLINYLDSKIGVSISGNSYENILKRYEKRSFAFFKYDTSAMFLSFRRVGRSVKYWQRVLN